MNNLLKPVPKLNPLGQGTTLLKGMPSFSQFQAASVPKPAPVVVPKPIAQPVQQPSSAAPSSPSSAPSSLDQDIVNIAKAIRQAETGNRPVKGASGELASRYQYLPGTWKSTAKKYLGDEKAPLTLENENKATYLKLKDWKAAGYNVGQIASMWNSGSPDHYNDNWRGVNDQGVSYDTPAYAKKVATYYQKFKKENPPVAPQTQSSDGQFTPGQPPAPTSLIGKVAKGISTVTEGIGKAIESTGIPAVVGKGVGLLGRGIGYGVGAVGGLVTGQKPEDILKTAKDLSQQTGQFGEMIGKEGTKAAPFAAAGKITSAALAVPSLYEGVRKIKAGDTAMGVFDLAAGALMASGAVTSKGLILNKEFTGGVSNFAGKFVKNKNIDWVKLSNDDSVMVNNKGKLTDVPTGNIIQKQGKKILTNIIRPSSKDTSAGFKIDNVVKYDIAGNVQESLTKAQQAARYYVKNLNELIKANPEKNISIADHVATLEAKAARGGLEMLGTKRQQLDAIENLKLDLNSVYPEWQTGKVDIYGATITKRAAGIQAAFEHDPMKAGQMTPKERVWTDLYGLLKKDIEVKSDTPALKAINTAISEIIPIENALIRRIPIEARQNLLGLDDYISLTGAIFKPEALALPIMKRLLKSPAFASTLSKFGKVEKPYIVPEGLIAGEYGKGFANQLLKTPETLGLPAPTPGAPKSSIQTPIELGAKAPSTIEANQVAKTQSQIAGSKDYTKVSDTLGLPAPTGQPSVYPTPIKLGAGGGEMLPKEILPTKKTSSNPLIAEAKKYKSAEEFVKAQGTSVLHGTADKFDTFGNDMKGSITGAQSAKGAIWFTPDEPTAKAYSIYAAETGPINKLLAEHDVLEKIAQKSGLNSDWSKVDELTQKIDDLGGYDATYQRRLDNANIKEAIIKGDFLTVDAKGKTPQEMSKDGDIDSWLNTQLEKGKKLGKDGVIFKNLDDAVGLSNRPADHYAVFDSKNIKTKSQLIDIWNKAHNTEKAKPINLLKTAK